MVHKGCKVAVLSPLATPSSKRLNGSCVGTLSRTFFGNLGGKFGIERRSSDCKKISPPDIGLVEYLWRGQMA